MMATDIFMYGIGHRDGYADGQAETEKRLRFLWLFAFLCGVLVGTGLASVLL